ncbi:MAG: exodeoxyribonuclease VII small subunit [Clostridiaceae bacterium]|nr:exodeoxyribonuclease VII small subunit [Clostridiaceae bacterium]
MEEKKMTFEQALARLEEIVALLEKGDAPLDQSLELYEEGAALVRRCNSALEQAERRVTILMKDQEGTVTEQVFDAGALDEA